MINVRPTNLPRVFARLKTIERGIDSTSIPHKKISIMLDQWVQNNFKTEGGKVGNWDSISRNGQILQDTGRLRSSFLPFSNKKDAGIGSDLPYSEVHEKGLGSVPRRRILPNMEDVKKDITDIFSAHIKKAAR